jgi:5-methylcytosine-specific restriction endonuclease McrA
MAGPEPPNYREYLASPAWQSLRRRVYLRSGGMCEGCGARPMQDVHHKTYENFGREFLWEIVGLCSECHCRIHGISEP